MKLPFVRLSRHARSPKPMKNGNIKIPLVSTRKAVIKKGKKSSLLAGLAVAIPPTHAGVVTPSEQLTRQGLKCITGALHFDGLFAELKDG